MIWTKGTDITEAYECHHYTLKPDQILPKYFVRKASKPRNFKFNFDENGFFMTLKRRIREKMETLDQSKGNTTKVRLKNRKRQDVLPFNGALPFNGFHFLTDFYPLTMFCPLLGYYTFKLTLNFKSLL